MLYVDNPAGVGFSTGVEVDSMEQMGTARP